MNKYSQSIAHGGIDVSQDHRMVEVRRDLWRSSCPSTLVKKGRLEQVSQDHDLTSKQGTFANEVFTYFSEHFWKQDLPLLFLCLCF